jgi:hypothetical protein
MKFEVAIMQDIAECDSLDEALLLMSDDVERVCAIDELIIDGLWDSDRLL